MVSVGIIDVNISNLMSVENALDHLSYQFVRVKQPEDIENIDHIILPGVGSFDHGVKSLQKNSIFEAIILHCKKGKPFLGICLGMQLLGTKSEESNEGINGLDIIPGTVKRFQSNSMRIPHIGWNNVICNNDNRIFNDVKKGKDYYFVHSYYFIPKEDTSTIAETNYILDFSSCINVGNIYGVQFHPEKSQKNGLKILDNFLKL